MVWVCSSSTAAENEMAIMMALRPNRNVTQLYGVCTDAADGKARIVMELCDHGSVRSHLRGLAPSKV
jgi:hypothetical protein